MLLLASSSAVIHINRHLIRRHHSTLRLPLCHPSFLVWSSNTSLGKTLVSAALASSFLVSPEPSRKFVYLKPVQTGFPSDSDSRFVCSKLSSLSSLHKSPLSVSHTVLKSSLPAAKSLGFDFDSNGNRFDLVDLDFNQKETVLSSDLVSRELVCKTLFAWEAAVSPHMAAEREGAAAGDAEVVGMMQRCLREEMEESERQRLDVMCVVETAGGVASPGPSGTLQCDLYRYRVLDVFQFVLIVSSSICFDGSKQSVYI